jgi:hypothetical protein
LHFPLDVSKDDDELGTKCQRHLDGYKNSVASFKKRQKNYSLVGALKAENCSPAQTKCYKKKLPKKVTEIASVK